MKNAFTKAIENASVLSPVCENREKIKTEEIKKYYPDGITITEFDFVDVYDKRIKENKECIVFAFKKGDNEYYAYGGEVLYNTFKRALAKSYEGNISEMRKDLKQGFTFKYVEKMSANGQPYNDIEILD